MAPSQESQIGPYQILKPLGQGGMGIVYHALHQDTKQEVALKTIKVPHELMLRSLRREIDALANLHHPGIVHILDQGLTRKEGLPWYAMELVKGKTLKQWRQNLAPFNTNAPSMDSFDSTSLTQWWTHTLNQKTATLVMPSNASPTHIETAPISQKLPQTPNDLPSGTAPAPSGTYLFPPLPEKQLQTLLTMAYRLCTPLAYLHGKGILHRDLKPQNIMITPEGDPVLVDFGLASLSGMGGEDSRENLALEIGMSGTAYYMSPEQIHGEPLDARSDLYALGVLLFEILCGVRPFGGQSFHALLAAHLTQTPPTPSEIVSYLPPQLDNLLLSLLDKERQGRPGYAEDIAHSLLLVGASKTQKEQNYPPIRPYLYRPRFWGRKDQLNKLSGRLMQDEGGVLLLGGESGVGKTRLALESTRRVKKVLPKNSRASFLLGTCEDRTTKIPLGAFRKILQAIADRCHAKGQEETERLLGPRGPLLALYEPSLQKLPGQSAYPSPVELSFQAAKLRLYSFLSQTLLAFIEQKPFLLVLDDLQWADELSLGFLSFFLTAESPLRQNLLILGTYRSEEITEELQQLLLHPAAEVHKVERLDEEAVTHMVGDMLSLSPAPKAFSQFLSKHSEGNPFFVAEYLRTALEEGLLLRDETGKWRLAESSGKNVRKEDYEKLGLPRSLRALVTRWLSGLSIRAREWLESAAILGRECSLELLEVMGFSPNAGLHELLARQVVEEPRAGFIQFTHDKLREGALAQITPQKIPMLHRNAAMAISQVFGEKGREGELGYHWELGGAKEKAKACYYKGARAAIQNYSHQEAERLYRAYLKLQEEPSNEHLKAQLELGETILQEQGKYTEALQSFQNAEKEAKTLQDKKTQAVALRLQGETIWFFGRAEEAQTLLDQALTMSRECFDANNEGMILGILASLAHTQGRTKQAKEFYDKALSIHRQTKNRKREGTILGSLANLSQTQGKTKQAKEFYQQALAIHNEMGNQKEKGNILNNLACLYEDQGQMKKGFSLLEKALVIHRQIGNRKSEGVILGNLAGWPLLQGLVKEAEDFLTQALDIHRQIGNRDFEGIALGNLALLYQNQNQFQRAHDFYRQALAIHHEIGNRRFEGIVYGNLGVLYQKQGLLEEAHKFLEQALNVHREIKDPRIEGIVLSNLANLQRQRQKNLQDCNSFAKKAETLLQEANDLLELPKLFCIQGHIALAQNKSAKTFLKKAKKSLDQVELGEKSEIGKSIAKLSRTQAVFDTGNKERLFRGELLDESPLPLKQWWLTQDWITPEQEKQIKESIS